MRTVKMENDAKYEVYSERKGQYGEGSVVYTLTRRVSQGETAYGIIIEEKVCGRVLRSCAEDITRDRDEALEMLEMFYNERLDACHLTDVLEEILPYVSFKKEKMRLEGKHLQFK